MPSFWRTEVSSSAQIKNLFIGFKLREKLPVEGRKPEIYVRNKGDVFACLGGSVPLFQLSILNQIVWCWLAKRFSASKDEYQFLDSILVSIRVIQSLFVVKVVLAGV